MQVVFFQAFTRTVFQFGDRLWHRNSKAMFTHNLVLIIEMKSKIFLQYFKDTVYHCQLECNRRNYGLLISPVEDCCIVITGLLLPKPRIIISIPCLPTSYLTNSVPDESHSPTELGPKHASWFQKRIPEEDTISHSPKLSLFTSCPPSHPPGPIRQFLNQAVSFRGADGIFFLICTPAAAKWNRPKRYTFVPHMWRGEGMDGAAATPVSPLHQSLLGKTLLTQSFGVVVSPRRVLSYLFRHPPTIVYRQSDVVDNDGTGFRWSGFASNQVESLPGEKEEIGAARKSQLETNRFLLIRNTMK